MTVTTPSIWYANFGNGSSTGYFAIGVWATLTAYTVGNITRQTAPTAVNSRCFVCIVAGTSLVSEPTWILTKGAKTVEAAGPTWMECTGQPGLNGDLASTPLSSQNRSGAQVLGNFITNNSQTHYFICTTAGTTGAGEPTYTTTTGGTTTDSGCTWTCLGAVGSFTAWMAPFPRLSIAGAGGLVRVPDGGTLYVSAAHAETAAANTTTFNGGGVNGAQTQVICVSNGCSFPPVAADITTGASVTVTGAFSLTIQGNNVEFNGFTFTGGTSSTPVIISNNTAFVRLRNSVVSTPSTGGDITIGIGATEFINTSVVFGNSVNQGFNISGSFTWRDTPNALSTTTIWPSQLFLSALGGNGATLIEGVDISAFAGARYAADSTLMTRMTVFSHCKIPASIPCNSSNGFGFRAEVIDFINCDNGGRTFFTQRFGWGCLLETTTGAVRTGGASDGTTAFGWSLTAAGTRPLSWANPYETMPVVVWNDTINPNNVIVTAEGAWVPPGLPYDDDIWFDVLYFGTASSVLSTRRACTKATTISARTQWSASSALWGGSASARQNTNLYSQGALIGVSSAGGIVRLFVCTHGGTSSGSLPGGYASAVDGDVVTDGGGGCLFTAVTRFAMTITLSAPQPQAAGYFYVYFKLANNGDSSGNYQTCFIDPKAELS